MEKGARYVYLAGAGLFLVGVLVQVFLAGMVVVAMKMGWDAHIGFGHSLGFLLLIMLVSMYLGHMPVKRLTWLLFGVYVLQADVLIFLRLQVPVLSALHPVLALIDFALAVALVRQAWALARAGKVRGAVQADLEPAVIK